MSEKLIIFDGNAVLHRAYHALPPLTTTDNEPINAVYGMISMLLRVVLDLKPTHLAFAFDTKEPTFRNKLFPDYQAQRVEVMPDLITQFAKARDTVQAFNIPFFEQAGFEADDLIGTIATEVKSQMPVIVVTGDRDMLQLVDTNVSLYMPVKGMSEGKVMDAAATKEKMGVPPEQIVDFKALVGDPSDNYKGVAGIGPKTAIGLLEKYGTLESIYEHLGELPKKQAEKLELGRDSAYMSQNLARIRCDVKTDFSLEASSKWQIDREEVFLLFERYGFNTLTRRVTEVGKQIQLEDQLSLL